MTKYPYAVKFVDNSGKEHVHDYEYKCTANLFYEQMKEFHPNSKPVFIDKKEKINMLKVLNIEYMGYAAATTGGVSFIASLETSKDRFPLIEEGMAYLNIVVPVKENEKITYRIVSRLISNGDITHWGEDEDLTEEEHAVIQKWLIENNIRKQGTDLAAEYKKQLETFFKLCDQLGKMYKEKFETIEEILERRNRIDEYQKQIDEVNATFDKLKNMKVS